VRALRYDTDGTEQYAVVEVDMHSMKLVADSLEILKTAIDQSANSIVVTDPDGNINYVNRAFEEITGYSFEEAVGENPRILKSGVHEKEFYTHLWETIRSGKVWSGEIVNKRKDGSLYTERMTITPVINEKRGIAAYIAVKEDITKEKELMNEIEKMEKERSKEHISHILLSVFMLLFRLGDEKITNEVIREFGDNLEKAIRKDFDDYLGKKSSDELALKKRGAYLLWLNEFFSDIAIENDIDLDKMRLVIHECPWNDMEGGMRPCVICRTIISRSFDWSEEKGKVVQQNSIAHGDKECVFDFRFQRR
jgi:PAS domain S-box-containing protein